MIERASSQQSEVRSMKQTQFIRNNARLRGGKKPPKPKEFERAEDVTPPPVRRNQSQAKEIEKCPKCGQVFDGTNYDIVTCPRCGQKGSDACCNPFGVGVRCADCENARINSKIRDTRV